MSYHNHPHYCDGSGTVEAYARAALAAALTDLGLSSHAPAPLAAVWHMPLAALPAYVAEVRAVREAFRGRLAVHLGLEVDYLPPELVPDGEAFQREHLFAAPLEYAVASVHYVGRDPSGRPFAIDESAEAFHRQVTEVYGGDARPLVEAYYAATAALAAQARHWPCPVILGHLDKVKMWNVAERYFPAAAPWYVEAAERALEAVRAAGLVVEVNTAGLRAPCREAYPAPWLLRRCRALGIPVTLSADAHRPEDVAAHFVEARALVREAGYTSVAMLEDGRWVPRPLPPEG